MSLASCSASSSAWPIASDNEWSLHADRPFERGESALLAAADRPGLDRLLGFPFVGFANSPPLPHLVASSRPRQHVGIQQVDRIFEPFRLQAREGRMNMADSFLHRSVRRHSKQRQVLGHEATVIVESFGKLGRNADDIPIVRQLVGFLGVEANRASAAAG